MPSLRIDKRGSLFYTAAGHSATSLVLLHGSLSDHTSWDRVMPTLSRDFRVIAYDRCGHGRSEIDNPRDSIFDDAEDLGRIIESVIGNPAHIAGTSGGAAIALRLACSKPHLFRSLTVHEPPLVEALPLDSEWTGRRQQLYDGFSRFVRRMEQGCVEDAVASFVDRISDGPGTWDAFPIARRDVFCQNAWTFYYECLDTDFMVADLAGLAGFDKPVLLTQGAKSADFFSKIIEILMVSAFPAAHRHTYAEAGHVPHETHPKEYAETVGAFIKAHTDQ